METIRGRVALVLDLYEFRARLANYERVFLDLGTGDGRYARALAKKNPRGFVIGLDACRENLREHSRVKLPNLLFAIASAHELPRELHGCVSHITVNFPWGSLLNGLLTADLGLLRGLDSVSCPGARLELRLNGGALAEAGTTLEAGAHTIQTNLLHAGWSMRAPVLMDGRELRSFPSTWAKRLSFGRDPRAVLLTARK